MENIQQLLGIGYQLAAATVIAICITLLLKQEVHDYRNKKTWELWHQDTQARIQTLHGLYLDSVKECERLRIQNEVLKLKLEQVKPINE